MPNRRLIPVIFMLACSLIPLHANILAHSIKKGVGMGPKGPGMGPGKHPREWQRRLKELHVHWFYDWRSRRPSATPKGLTFVPMIWGDHPIVIWNYHPNLPASIKRIIHYHHSGLVQDMLGFNEPDNRTQSVVSVSSALKAWPELESAGTPLGSPACVLPDSPWMKAFMRGVQRHHYRVNFMCIHWYGGPYPKAFIGMLRHIHNLFHRPLWITEFGVGDWKANKTHPNIYSPQVVARYMRTVLPVLNRLPYVQRYAWFPSRKSKFTGLGTSALFNKNGTLTRLGRIYAAD